MVLIELEDGDIVNTRFIKRVYSENITKRGDEYSSYNYYMILDGDDGPTPITSYSYDVIRKLCENNK